MVAVTGLGSLPGTDYPGAVAMTFENVPVPYVPELPARGPHATMIARGAASLTGISAELTTSGWRVSPSAGADLRRARALLRDDLDMLAETVPDFAGPVRVSVVGPWTLIAALELPRGGRALADTGARRDLASSLKQGTDDLLYELTRRLPTAEPSLHLDEPSLPAVLGGAIPTAGGLFRIAAIDEAEAFGVLAEWASGADVVPTVVHSCAPGLPVWPLLKGTDLAGVSLDVTTLTSADLDGLAAALDAGRDLLLGVVSDEGTGVDAAVDRAWSVLRALGADATASDRLWVTPACGLATWTPKGARAVWRTLTDVARRIEDRLAG
jgi:methionine synthase II (cobalamin-independent)